MIGHMDALPSRIRALRRRQQRTLRDIAERCGFTVSLLSKIESGKTHPPVATLTRIATALGVTLSDLVSEQGERTTTLTSAAELAKLALTPTDKGYGFHLLAAARAAKTMQPFIFVAKRGEVRPGALSHAGEEFVHVLAGRMRYRVGAVTYLLGAGDSLYFDATDEHDIEPITATVRYLAVLSTPPALAPMPALSPPAKAKGA